METLLFSRLCVALGGAFQTPSFAVPLLCLCGSPWMLFLAEAARLCVHNCCLVISFHQSEHTQPNPVQVIRTALLKEGFEAVRSKNLAVTDDVSIVEALGKPVKITEGSYTNIK
eukprot:scaffold221640_cov22-Tisochrysis_lutea.AAC.1